MTTMMLAEIVRLNKEEGLCDAEIARRLGVKSYTVWRWRDKLHLPAGENGKRNERIYAFYDRASTQFLCEGTLRECAKALGISYKSIHPIISRTRSGELKKYDIYKCEQEEV